jgi:putative ABC transport system permease protein
MSLFSRIVNAFRGEIVNRDIDEELQYHIDEAIAQGRDPEEARRAFGSGIRIREHSRDIKVAARLDSLRADLVFGWRQILKRKIASLAAILSLGLAMGACTTAFRLIDAMLLRPLPVSSPERLHVITFEQLAHDGKLRRASSFDYLAFRQLRNSVKESAELMAISHPARIDLTFSSDHEMEKAHRQYVSGWTLGAFGLKPSAGRLLTEADDVTPGGHPYAVLSYDYWSRRFGRDPRVVGRRFRIANDLYEIIGIVEQGFTGTETGTLTDIFLPTMMNAAAVNDPDTNWFRTWVQLRQGVSVELVRQKLQASLHALRQEKVKAWSVATPRERIEHYVNAPVFLESASAGVSWMQDDYRRSLIILAVLVVLVVLIVCANLANLMTAQAAWREREMALRVSIGAGRGRLVQLVLIESTLIAVMASAIGGVLAWPAAPLVVSMINPPHNPARLVLPADWRVLGFAIALTMAVTFLFGLAPALHASAVKPVNALKGGEDPHSRRRLMNALVAAQVAFCFLVHSVAGLFVVSFQRMVSQPTGFSSDRVLILETVAKTPQPHSHWDQVIEKLRSMTGTESVALSRWALLSGTGWNQDIWANGRSPDGIHPSPYFHGVSPGWLETMKIPLIDGRDFRQGETFPNVAIVNEAFARFYFNGENPVGKSFEKMHSRTRPVTVAIIGYIPDVRYSDMREPIRPTIYVPFRRLDEDSVLESPQRGSFIVRTAGDPLQLASMLRHAVTVARPELRVSNIRTQAELVRMHTIRERLLAMLSLFFAVVALLLAGIGLYGVLDYSVARRRREIGIRIAVGAPAGRIVRDVLSDVVSMVVIGAVVGLGLGVASERYIESLLYEVRATDLTMLLVPVLALLTVAVLASFPPAIRAVRTDPVTTIRVE